MRTFFAAALLGFTSLSAQAGGTEISGGKTNSAVLVYNLQLDSVTQQLILNEIGKQMAMGKIGGYGLITDLEGNPAHCVSYKLLDTYATSVDLLLEIAARAGVPGAVREAGSCRLDTIN